MLLEYIKKVSIAATSGAEEGSTMMVFLLSVGIFFLPKIVKAPKLDAKAKKLLRWVLLNKFLTNMEWRVGVAACFFFAIHVLIVTPYRIYSEDQNVIADQKNRASEDYISENRAYLEAWLLIESVTNNQVFYHYEVENKGKLPATSITERQSTDGFIYDDGNNTPTPRSLDPNGKMYAGVPYIPANINDVYGLKTSLTLNYKSKVNGTNIDYTSTFNFAVPNYEIQPGIFPYLNAQVEISTNKDFMLDALEQFKNVSTLDAALQVFPEVLQIVDVRVAVGVFARSVIDRLVAVSRFPQPFVGMQLVRVNRCAVQDVFFNDRLQGFLGDVRDYLGHHLSTALHHAKYNCFVRRSASATAMRATPDVGFINFNISKQWPFVVNLRDMLADKVAHAPRRLVGYAKLALQFLRRNAMPRRGEQINGVKPQLQRRAAILKRSADSWVDVVAAPLAGVGAFSFDAKPVGFAFALRAGMIRAEAGFKKVLQANFIGRELRQKFADCQAGFNNVFRFRFHALNIRSNHYVCEWDTSVTFSGKDEGFL